jgi:hypothetical protein
MMNTNKVPATEVALIETGVENGEESKLLSEDNGNSNQRFGLMDLWSIRRSARKFKIHNRLPRL